MSVLNGCEVSRMLQFRNVGKIAPEGYQSIRNEEHILPLQLDDVDAADDPVGRILMPCTELN